MATTLLKCSICPNQPTFSDTSHLLTHVSSKGHLSNLHKLQVQSVQESNAGRRLAAYNQWYQQHDLGRLLSERMLQRQSKKATRPTRSTISPTKVKKEVPVDTSVVAAESQRLAVDPRFQQTPPRLARRSRTNVGSILQPSDDESDLDSSPVKQLTNRKTSQSFPSLIKRSSSDASFEILGAVSPSDIDSAILDTPDNSKLRGVIWPGMHLFDAATAEMRRRRHQKKDDSEVLQMEKTSKGVQPTEVIYSKAWTSIKRRPITGMVEDSSPFKAESPLPKPARHKRPAMAEVNANVPRNLRKPFKHQHSQGTQLRRSHQGSLNATSYAPKSRFSPTEDETMEFKLTVGDLVHKKKGGNFMIFHDKESNPNPHQLPNTMTERMEAAYTHFAPAQMQARLPQARPNMQFTRPSWLQPQYQQPQTYQSLYRTPGSGNPRYYAHQNLGPGRENIEPWFPGPRQAEYRMNPLGWNHNAMTVQNPYQAYNFSYDGQIRFSGIPSQDDVFGYSVNPLKAAYQNLEDGVGETL